MDLKSSLSKRISSSSLSTIPSPSINQSSVQYLRMVLDTQLLVLQLFFNQNCTTLKNSQISFIQHIKINLKDLILINFHSQSFKTDQTHVETTTLVSSTADSARKTWKKPTRGSTKSSPKKSSNNKIKTKPKRRRSSEITMRRRGNP